MKAMGLYDLKSSLNGQIEIDETYFILNMKGYKNLPRPSKKRKTMSYKHGLNKELVSVVTAVDENDRILIEIAGPGNLGADSIIDALDERIESHSIFTTLGK